MGNGLCTREGLWEELVFSVEKVCCEASDLHSVVRRINVEPFPFDVCEQASSVQLYNAINYCIFRHKKKCYVLLYLNMRLPRPWPQSWNTTLYQSCPPLHTHTQGVRVVSWRKSKRVFYIWLTGKFDSFQQSVCWTLQTNLNSDDISMCFKYCSNVGPSTSGGTAALFLFD